MKASVLAPVSAVILAAAFFGASAISSASADDQPVESVMYLGEEPVFYTPENAKELFYKISLEDPDLKGVERSEFEDGAEAMFAPTNEDGDPYSYEQGYIESVAATASRCYQLSDWQNDSSLSPQKVQQLADQQFKTYSKIPAISELSDVNVRSKSLNQIAFAKDASPVETEITLECGAFGGIK